MIKKIDNGLTPETKVIIECCKLLQDSQVIENNIRLIGNFEEFLFLAHSHGIFPLIYKTLKNYTQISSELQNIMKQMNMNIIKQNILMTSELLKVSKLLKANDIEIISFKGPSLSQIAYGDVVSRQYCDLDILVNEKFHEKAQVILKENDYFSKFELEDYQKENLKKVVHDVSMINKVNGVNIELHWTLSSTEFFIDLEKLKYLNDMKKYIISNQEINIFSNEKLFIYLCIHGYKHFWERIEWLVDIYYLIENENINLEKVLEMAEYVSADRIVLSTLIICQKIFNLKISLKDYSKIEDKKLNKMTNQMLYKILNSYTSINEKVHNKQFSIIHLYMLKTIINRFKYFKAFFIPTEIDYQSIKLPKYFGSFYFLIRPFNIIKRVFTN
jgi:hypothetical protein